MKEKKWKHRHPQKAFTRAERKEQIMGQFAIWQGNQDTEPKTMNRIAKALGMTPQSQITDMLLELVEEGQLAFVEREKSGRWTARAYYSPFELLSRRNTVRRSITLRKRGVAVGQLELAL